MNDFSELEAQLKQLRPAAPSADLTTRVERSLAETPAATPTAGILPRPVKRSFRLNWFALGLGAAVAATFLVLARMDLDRPAPTQQSLAVATPAAQPIVSEPAPSLRPDGVTRVVYNTSDEGLVYPRYAAAPVRRMRSHSRETLEWKNPGTGASLRVSYPTEEVELIPISVQ